MVAFHAFGSTSKYCFLCSAPCFVPETLTNRDELTCRDRRHLANIRILGRKGISHPGLTWQFSAELNAMTCLGYSCPIYREFDPTQHDCCLSVHRSCYTLLLDQLERSEGSFGSRNLMQRLAPHVDKRGILQIESINKRKPPMPPQQPRQQQRQRSISDPLPCISWAMCDPTDIPSIDTSNGGSEFSPAMLVNGKHDLHGEMYFADSQTIPVQLLTPPMSPVKDSEEKTFEFGSLSFGRNFLLELPTPILLLIVSNLRLPEIIALSQTCSTLRMYLSAESHIWSHICRSTLSYTPRLLYNRQIAEYYLRVRGNERTETKVLLHRERIEKVIQHIICSKN